MSDETKPWIKAKMLIEVAGFPQEHVDHAMKLITEKFAADRTDVRNISKKTNAAKKVESPDVKEFYTGFLEIDAEYEDIIALLHLTLEFLPSHVEIIAPENIQLATTNLTELFTDISGRIHQYESMVRSLKADQEIMEREYNKEGAHVKVHRSLRRIIQPAPYRSLRDRAAGGPPEDDRRGLDRSRLSPSLWQEDGVLCRSAEGLPVVL